MAALVRQNRQIRHAWACYINRRRYPVLEQTFEGIAATRVKILTGWAGQQWAFLAGLAEELARDFPRIDATALQNKRALARDFSELFVVGSDGRVIASTHAARKGAACVSPQAWHSALNSASCTGHIPIPSPCRSGLPPPASTIR
ncbi:hypothetical protein [Methylogaea oryzae]|uniref:hypothetical protein n=1 Tax=Methylogaea oryzae TaxID=1295382 RepID=UPI000A87F4EE|nr:hypothetical protein [Methylogaea oryzae]